MKKFLIIAVLLINVVVAYSQDKKKDDMFSNKINKRGDMLIIDFFDDIWMNVPSNIKNRAINQGISVSVTYNFPLGHSPFSLAAGLGIKSHNFYSDGVLKTDSVGSYFSKIPVDYKISKLSVTYLQLPIEVRFKSKSKFRAALGFNIGFKIDGHTKYKGTDFDYFFRTSDQIKIKVKNTPNLASWNFAVTARAGYRWVNFFASYSITKIFTENKGPTIYPISVGISIIPF